MATFTAVVPTTGEKVDLTFSESVASPDISKYHVLNDGVVVELGTATGAGTDWSLPLTVRAGWIIPGTVKVTCVGDGAVTAQEVTATNNTIRTTAQRRHVERGLGTFVHFGTRTYYGGAPPPYGGTYITLSDVQNIDMPSYDMEQWFTSVIVPSGARFATFTAKHFDGFSWWPTDAGNWDIRTTAYGVAHPEADLVRDWVRLCRKYNIAVGLYILFADQWHTHYRPGATEGYVNPLYTNYMNQQITELLSNYGRIDMLWCDQVGVNPGYAVYPWATIVALRDSLQPDCVLLNNSAESDLSHCDVLSIELPIGGVIPPTSNTVPSECCDDMQVTQQWFWDGLDNYKNVYTVASNVNATRNSRSDYLINFPPNTSGVMPASTGTYASQLGAIVGKRGANPVLPSVINVRSEIDRGDGQGGLFGGGVNGSAILGVL